MKQMQHFWHLRSIKKTLTKHLKNTLKQISYARDVSGSASELVILKPFEFIEKTLKNIARFVLA